MNILCVGVGGQGTVLASKLIAQMAMLNGDDIDTAETIGMAQKGGSVVSHIRINKGVCSPLMPKGKADLVIAFEVIEAIRTLPYCNENTKFLINEKIIKPFSLDNTKDMLFKDYFNYLDNKGFKIISVNTDKIAKELNNSKIRNVALVAYAIKYKLINYSVDSLKNAVKNIVKPKFVDLNIKAIDMVINN
ncbi:MAG: indolepyruvate oxidoreductase subunit beta [Christensenellaceae bacterium]|nr:indolepyruvate oxidoreductase subunit beta [Christensenellaceae bacterium]